MRVSWSETKPTDALHIFPPLRRIAILKFLHFVCLLKLLRTLLYWTELAVVLPTTAILKKVSFLLT